jgi:hypothetical protein
MTRLEENNKRIKALEELTKLNPSVTYEKMMALHLGTIAAMLADISQSLAVLADKAERKGER